MRQWEEWHVDEIPKPAPIVVKWTPTAERMPIEEFREGQKNGTVYDLYPCLVTRRAMHSPIDLDWVYVCKSYFDGEVFLLHGGYQSEEEDDTPNTLAWAPLPEPYRGQD